MSTVASFNISYTELVNAGGEARHPLPEFARDPKSLLAMYRAMVLSRLFDRKAVALQRTGYLDLRIGARAGSDRRRSGQRDA